MKLNPLPRPVLMLVTEPHPQLMHLVGEAVVGGVNAIQVRDHRELTQEDRDLYGLLRWEHLPREIFYAVNVADHSALHTCKPDAIHLRERGMSVLEARKLYPQRRILVGRSVHSIESARAAEEEGADYLIAGTVFPSSSHPDLESQGLGFLRDVCRAVQIPVIAIGGITPENARQCLQAGAAGVAVISGILHADDPRAAALRYAHSMELPAT